MALFVPPWRINVFLRRAQEHAARADGKAAAAVVVVNVVVEKKLLFSPFEAAAVVCWMTIALALTSDQLRAVMLNIHTSLKSTEGWPGGDRKRPPKCHKAPSKNTMHPRVLGGGRGEEGFARATVTHRVEGEK